MGMWTIGFVENDSSLGWTFVDRPKLSMAVSALIVKVDPALEMVDDLLIGIGEAINDMHQREHGAGFAEIGDMDMERAIIKVSYSEGET